MCEKGLVLGLSGIVCILEIDVFFDWMWLFVVGR